MNVRAVLAAMAIAGAVALPALAQNAGDEWETHTRAAVKAFGLAQMDVAEAEAKVALALAEKNFPATDERLQTSVANSFSIEKALDHFDDAIALGNRLEAMQRKADATDPNLAITISMLAGVYQAQKNVDMTIATYTRAIATYTKNIGPDDPLSVAVRENYAVALGEFGRTDEAVKLWQQVLADWVVALGPDHLRRSMSYTGYAELMHKLGREAEAAKAEAEAKRIQDLWYGAQR